ncbi:phospholipase D-like domain-containing protein [Pandoraea sp. NPDC090278]|uniref:phospholipase D-like domain-containing protein n=1 Tax=Pandoraea sp. NPDC090278 TaxID=3364391 RepID=UPI00383AE5FE
MKLHVTPFTREEHVVSGVVVDYSFASAPIATAIKRAKDRCVDVKVILDKSQRSQKYSRATYLRNADFEVVIDTKPAIAHNRVMIFYNNAVFTGSFNFTKSA